MEHEVTFTVGEAHHRGWLAAEEGRSIESNEYLPGTREWNAWETGWWMCREGEEACPPDPVQELLQEVRTTVKRRELGLDHLLDKLTRSADMLADALSMHAPPVLLEQIFRPEFRKWSEELLSRTPPVSSKP